MKLRSRRCAHPIIPALLSIMHFLVPVAMHAQSNHDSPVFRNYRPPESVPFVFRSTRQQQANDFLLLRDASNGDAEAQHELGLRYLFGNRFEKDTAKAVYWMKKASDQSLIVARYNFGLLQNNGWGVEWNPFDAFRNFLFAAENDMTEAQFVTGLFYTDNMVVQRNWITAYRWIKKAADKGLEPAKETMREIIERGYVNVADSVDPSMPQPSLPLAPSQSSSKQTITSAHWTPVFLDFSPDTTEWNVDNMTLLKNMFGSFPLPRGDSLALVRHFTCDSVVEAANLDAVFDAAASGNPDAAVLLARCYEEGRILRRDPILSASWLLRAVYMDARLAPRMLWDIVQSPNVGQILRVRAKGKDRDAMFVWAGLVALEFDRSMTGQQALDLLRETADQNHIPSLLLLGVYLTSGKLVKQNREGAMAVWKQTGHLGNNEAAIRLAAAAVLEPSSSGERHSADIDVLRNGKAKGSLIAEVALAWCYQHGREVVQSKGEAVRLYRDAAQRGSTTAHRTLRDLYDDVRPEDTEFQVPEM